MPINVLSHGPGNPSGYQPRHSFDCTYIKIEVELKESMGFEQYHEPAQELPEETRTFARMIASLSEEADAINLVSTADGG